MLSRDLRKQVHQSCLPYLRLAGHSSLFRFPSGDIMCGIPERNLSQHPMGYDPILSGMISCGLYAKPFAWESLESVGYQRTV